MSNIGLPIREYEVKPAVIPKEFEEVPVPGQDPEKVRPVPELVPVPVKK